MERTTQYAGRHGTLAQYRAPLAFAVLWPQCPARSESPNVERRTFFVPFFGGGMSDAPVVMTHDAQRIRLIQRLRDDLRKEAIVLMHSTIERLIDAYDRRRARAGAHRTDADPLGSAEGNRPA